MLTVIGVLLLAFAVYLFVASSMNKQRIESNNVNQRKMALMWCPTNKWMVTGIGIGVILLNGMFFWADAGTVYSV